VEEALMFGVIANVALDQCYHQACDNATNLNMDAFETHTKAIADAVATYSLSWEGFPARNTTAVKRSAIKSRKTAKHGHHRSGCAQLLMK
jgi:fructose-1,6-bisphosphatase/inositol monophosphatase family enzyme